MTGGLDQDGSAERVGTANLGGMLEARDAGTGHGKGANRDTPDQTARASLGASNESPSRADADNLTSLKRVIEKSRGECPSTKRKTDR
jgi:hypothetical protein